MITTKMDENLLIDTVSTYPELWDKSHPKYKDVERSSNIWTQITHQLYPYWDEAKAAEQSGKFYLNS